ncbi:MAG: SIS domain-containing protein [Spirochaetota bacterium]|nr:SIS domain-containing protein [Spirochaetota bacterium]
MEKNDNNNMYEILYKVANRNIDNLNKVLENSREEIVHGIVKSSNAIASSIKNGGKVIICGNGGSAAQSQHIAAEFVVRLQAEPPLNREAYPAIALTTDTSILTASANDFGFQEIFARQIEALGRKGDILIVISTSGNSENVYKAARKATEMKIPVIGILGGDGGKLKEISTIPVIVSSCNTQRVQEIHMNIGHSIVENVEEILSNRFQRDAV